MRGGTLGFSFLFSRVGIPTMFMFAMLNRVNQLRGLRVWDNITWRGLGFSYSSFEAAPRAVATKEKET